MKPAGENEWQPNRWATLGNLAAAMFFWTLTVVIVCAMAWR